MPPTDAKTSGRDHPTRRYLCPWCEAAETWPDGCSESIDAPADTPTGGPDIRCCATMIEKQCSRGDHRRCRLNGCTVAARWHEPVREAGVTAANDAEHAWAVVSTINNEVEVIGTTDDLTQAKHVLRDILSESEHLSSAEGKGLVYVVRRSDGGFL